MSGSWIKAFSITSTTTRIASGDSLMLLWKPYADQGIEKEDSAAAKPAKTPKGSKGEGDDEEKGASSAKGKKKCLVCGKKHTPFCKLPEGFRKKQRDEQKKRKAEANASSEAKKAK